MEKESQKFAADMLRNHQVGNYSLLARYIANSAPALLVEIDPLAPSKVGLLKLNELKNAISLFRIWTRCILDSQNEEGSRAVLLALGDDFDQLEDDVFNTSRSSQTFAALEEQSAFIEGDIGAIQQQRTSRSRASDMLYISLVDGVADALHFQLVPCTRHLLFEATRLLLTLLSCDIRSESENHFLTALSVNSEHLGSLLASVANHILAPRPAPARTSQDSQASTVSGFVSALTSPLVSVISSPFSLLRYVSVASPPPVSAQPALSLSVECSLLLLALSYSRSIQGVNVFLRQLALLPDSSDPESTRGCPAFSFPAMFTYLSSTSHVDASIILLYTLIYNNKSFYGYVVSRTSDLDQLLLPLLQHLSSSRTGGPDVYLILVTLLMLSQDTQYLDACFGHSVQDDLTWYSERSLRGTSVGDVWMLVLTRLLQVSVTATRDRFVTDIALACLCNMAPHVVHLSEYTSQRLVLLFAMFTKHHLRLARRPVPAHSGATKADAVAQSPSSASLSSTPHQAKTTASSLSRVSGPHTVTPSPAQQTAVDATSLSSPAAAANPLGPVAQSEQGVVVEMVVQRLLACITTILACRLRFNTDLVYSVLVDQDAFLSIQHLKEFSMLASPIATLVSMVSARYSRDSASASVDDVRECISAVTQQLPDNRLRRPDMERFEYEQTLQPQEFFVPCIWAAVLGLSPLLRSDLDYLAFQ